MLDCCIFNLNMTDKPDLYVFFLLIKNLCYCTWCWDMVEGKTDIHFLNRNILVHKQQSFTAMSHQRLGRIPEQKAKCHGKKVGFTFGFSNMPVSKSLTQIQTFSNQVCQFFQKTCVGFSVEFSFTYVFRDAPMYIFQSCFLTSVFIDASCFYNSFVTCIGHW